MIQKKNIETISTLAATLAGIFFLLHYLDISLCIVPMGDDFHFMIDLKNYGIVGSVLQNYNEWTTRWAAVFFLNLQLWLYSSVKTFFIFQLMTVAFFIWPLYKIQSLYISSATRLKKWTTTTFFFAAFYCMSFSKTEMFFWTTASCMYLWSIIAGLWLTYFVLSEKKTFFTHFLIALASIFIGSASESAAIAIALVLLISAITNNNREKYISKIVTAFILIIVALIVAYMGEGRTARAELLAKPDVLQAMKMTAASILYFFDQLMSYSFQTILGLLIILFTNPLKEFFSSGKKPLLIFGIAFILFVTNIFIACYLLSDRCPDRVYTLSLFSMLIMLSYLSWKLHQQFSFLYSWNQTIAAILMITLIKYYSPQTKSAREYNSAYVFRLNNLLYEEEGLKAIRTLPKSDFFNLPDEFCNASRMEELKNLYGIKCNFYCDEPQR